ncbi:hypothetical protein [Gracilinema caldarium]|uniref:hypothetical protein n=1 Tax=Gracilinema caldarium TaxID=215591 RepID=UPI0026F19B87|nr:hypothetical protein [Gracilinema caldarium]
MSIKNALYVSIFCFVVVTIILSPERLIAEQLLSQNLAKSTGWVSIFVKKDQDAIRSIVAELDKIRSAMMQDTKTVAEALVTYRNKIRLLESLLDRYRSDESAFMKAEQWLELPVLTVSEAEKELSRLRLLYLTEARSYADYQYGHRTTKELLTYSKQEELLLKNGKALADFLASRITKSGKSSLKPMALSLASRLMLHPDCPAFISELTVSAEQLPPSQYRQWILILARGSPSALTTSAIKGLADSAEGKNFEKLLTLFNATYQKKKQIRELIPTGIVLSWYTDRLAGFASTEGNVPALNTVFLQSLFSDKIAEYANACGQDQLLSGALLEILTQSWVYATRPELWVAALWPFGNIAPDSIRIALQKIVQESEVVNDKNDISWSTVVSAESYAVKLQKPQELSGMLPIVSEFMLKSDAFAVFLESNRYEQDRSLLFQRLTKAFYEAPTVASLAALPFNQVFLLLQSQSMSLLQPEILGLLIAKNQRVTKEQHPWLATYVSKLSRANGIPEKLLINNNLYGQETICMNYIHAGSSCFRLVFYVNQLESQE